MTRFDVATTVVFFEDFVMRDRGIRTAGSAQVP
jgi:hypothetical protein